MAKSEVDDVKNQVLSPGRHTDVLILVALQDELDAVLEVADGGRTGWEPCRDRDGFTYYRHALSAERCGTLELAVAWVGEIGDRGATSRGQSLILELAPYCIAMCGICAGNREKGVSLGDIIVADRLYDYDHGKQVADDDGRRTLIHDLRTFNLDPAWKMDAELFARSFDRSELASARPPSKEAQFRWLLHAIAAHQAGTGRAPVEHPERAKVCPEYTNILRAARDNGFIARVERTFVLTEVGKDAVNDDLASYPEGLPPQKPVQIHFGAIATSKTVQQDPSLFARLGRTTFGLDMESAAIGELAQRSHKYALVVKAVSDHADGNKDDTFRAFACKASATFLLAFFQKCIELSHLNPKRDAPARVEVTLRAENDFLSRVERLVKSREQSAEVTAYRAPAPFAGILEVAVKDGSRVRVDVVGALDGPITPELLQRFIDAVERPFRVTNPHLDSKLVYNGLVAPVQLADLAYHRGIRLKSFAEYQGLIDFTRYVQWQTQWLDSDLEYAHSLYVDQPGRYSFAALRERRTIDSTLDALWEDLGSEHRRFLLVVGKSGAGKTFLLRQLARRMAREKHPLIPVLVRMEKLEKSRSLRALVAQHFAMVKGAGQFDIDAFDYMLAEGKIALLFDGFDELAARISYGRVMEHFNTVLEASRGRAKVIVTSRREYFLTDKDVRLALTERAQLEDGYRLLELELFGQVQIKRFLMNLLQDAPDAEGRYAQIQEVKDLGGLSANPRMLSFIAKINSDKLEEARSKTGEITAAKLYELLVEQWLDFEYERANPTGAPPGIPRESLREAMTDLALFLWPRASKSFEMSEMPAALLDALAVGGAKELDREEVRHSLGSGSLLNRDADGQFSFLHRSILEWLVAFIAASQLREGQEPKLLAADEMSALMTDFFLDLTGREPALQWASKVSTQHGEALAKTNAMLVIQRIEHRWGKLPDVDIPIDLDLEGQDFRGKDLSGVDWRNANLSRADLRDAILVGANLAGASLVNAKLSGANLNRTNLAKADLSGADFSNTRLMWVDFSEARGIDEATFVKANLLGAYAFPEKLLTKVAAEGAVPPALHLVEPMVASNGPIVAGVAFTSGHCLGFKLTDCTYGEWEIVGGTRLWAMDLSLSASEEAAVEWAPFMERFYGSFFTSTEYLDAASKRLVIAQERQTLRALSEKYYQRFETVEVAASSDGMYRAAGSRGGAILLYDGTSEEPIATYVSLLDGWVAFTPSGRYKLSGDIGDAFWHQAGEYRFKPGELEEYMNLRVPMDEPLLE